MEDAERRTRRAILVLAENLPESEMEKAYAVFLDGMRDPHSSPKGLLSAALVAALMEIVEGK